MIDRFGDAVELKRKNKDSFYVKVPVCLSKTFYGWVFQFVGKMNIVAPEYVREAYARYLQDAIDDVLGE